MKGMVLSTIHLSMLRSLTLRNSASSDFVSTSSVIALVCSNCLNPIEPRNLVFQRTSFQDRKYKQVNKGAEADERGKHLVSSFDLSIIIRIHRHIYYG